jgi:hypothetical protein
MWVDLAPGAKDLELTDAIERYLGDLRAKGVIEGFTLARRKFGFGIPGLGEFHVRVHVKNAAQLEEAFAVVAPREDPVEGLHAAVFTRVCNYKAAYYRDFPDPVRVRF